MRFFKSFCLAALSSAALFAAVLSVAMPARAFTLVSNSDSSMKGWSNSEITFHLNPANCPAGVRDIIGNAMNAWNGVVTSNLVLTLGDDTSTTEAQLRGGTATDVPVIVCDTAFSSHSGIGGNGIAGVALSASPPAGGHISYSYLLINVESGSTGNISTASPTLVSVVMAHEIGHVLGLGHSPDINALMYYSAGAKQNLSLAQDDIDGITYLYPRNEPSDKIAGCALVDVGSNKKPPGGFLLTVLLLLAPIALALKLKTRSARFA